jgi:hypothetical protein
MTLPTAQRRSVRAIEQDLTASDPQLAGLLVMFTKLADDDAPPAEETLGGALARALATLGKLAQSAWGASGTVLPACQNSGATG